MASTLPVNGYLYVAYGLEHFIEATRSVSSLRNVDSSAHITLITTERFKNTKQNDLFDNIITVSDVGNGLEGKVKYLAPVYSRTFFVDTDTYFVSNCSSLFDLLRYYDLLAMPDPGEVELQPGLVCYNTGILLFGNQDKVRNFFHTFRDLYFDPIQRQTLLTGHPAEKQKTDQPFFTLALKQSELKVCPLPNNYNFRFRFNISIRGKARILHGPDLGYEDISKHVNKEVELRNWSRYESKKKS